MQMKLFLALISVHEEWSFHAWRKAIANKHMEEECLLDISVGISIRASVLENLPEVSFLNLLMHCIHSRAVPTSSGLLNENDPQKLKCLNT